MLRKNIYKWHRTCSLIIAIPVLLWALSGFMHPIMTNIRPKVATQFLQPGVIDSSKIRVPLEEALQLNHINSFSSFRIVHIENNWFYQVQVKHGSEPLYFATLNGKLLVSGNWLYAQYLGKQFLEGQSKDTVKRDGLTAVTSEMQMDAGHDCCDAATDCIVNNKKGSKVTDASLISEYNTEYKSINRLLPVYRVSFDRQDGIRLYVEPTTDRFAFAMDDKRRVFDRIFTMVHTWGWLDFLGKGKFMVEFLLVSLAFLTTVMGIYIFFSTKSKKVPGNELTKARRNHRYTSIVIALFTLMFTFSGAYHALSKLKDNNRADFYASDIYKTARLHFDITRLQSVVKASILNVSIARMNEQTYWRVQIKKANPKGKPVAVRKDLMKDAAVTMPSISYVSADGNYLVLTNGEEKYARYLASQFSKRSDNEVVSLTGITKFGSDYNFTDKRLPVWKVQYRSNSNERYFIETTTASLSKKINDVELIQDYSFAFFHKHEFLGWAGKGWKDFSTMFWAMSQVAMVTIGLILYFKWRRKRYSTPKL